MEARALVFATRSGDRYRAGRTSRSLRAAGIETEEIGELTPAKLDNILEAESPILLIRAGAWLARPDTFHLPLSSATGKGLCALGAVRCPRESESRTAQAATAWNMLLAETGGELARSPNFPEGREELASIYLDAVAVTALRKVETAPLAERLHRCLAALRAVHWSPLDVFDDAGMRVLQVITALHRGGAERMTLNLMTTLVEQDVRTRLVTLGRSLRESFPLPPGTVELAPMAADPAARAAVLLKGATHFGADLVHGHLITGAEARSISAAGLPLLLTLHNTRPGWPEGMATLNREDAALLVACSQAVATDLAAAGVPVPIRTAWNGIQLRDFQRTSERLAAGGRWRQKWGFGPDDFVMVAVANPRPQKRLHLLPGILAATRALLSQQTRREGRLVFVGEAMPGNRVAGRCQEEIQAEVTRLGLEPHVRWTGPVAEVADLLAGTDALVSTSAHEGLSLAQIEALAMDRFVVATDAGGARELATGNPAMHVLPVDAPAEAYAKRLCAWATDSLAREQRFTTRDHWSVEQMARRYRWLYPRAIKSAHPEGVGLWLITNNFSTGGAQSSARRLLTGLAAQGVRVRAAVVEEEPTDPTPGRRALQSANIPVLALRPPGPRESTPELAVLLEAMDSDPPAGVLFWNLRPAYKILIADALLRTPVFDISPGEMYFDSLHKFFSAPHPGLPYRTAGDYGARLSGVIVKYQAETNRAKELLGVPVHVVPNGVPMLAAQAALRPTHETLVFGTAARIHPQKRLEDLLEAFRLAQARLPAFTLRIAGGVERDCDEYALQLRAQAQGLPVEWLGDVSDMAAFHQGLDGFVMISEPAGCPNASLEAMAAGLPVIATDVGGASEQVMDAVTGFLVPSRNPSALADALVALAAQPEVRRLQGIRAREHIQQHFSMERMLADYRRICLP